MKYTLNDVSEMWKRPFERQYNIAITRMLEAIRDTKGDINISFSGGKDSCLLLDMFAEIWKDSKYKDKPIECSFVNTTNETNAILNFIPNFINYIETKYGVIVNLKEYRPKTTWAKFTLENGIPLISKDVAMKIEKIRKANDKINLTFDELKELHITHNFEKCYELGMDKTTTLFLTGYCYSKNKITSSQVSLKWLPMVFAPIPITSRCCYELKERTLSVLKFKNIMTGEMAQESERRKFSYMKTGCNFVEKGVYKSKPFGAMTCECVLWALNRRNTPICDLYGDIVYKDWHWMLTGVERTGCSLCGFGCNFHPKRFVDLQKREPSKVKFAFTKCGYAEDIEYMNKHCRTKIIIPKIEEDISNETK